MPEANDANDVLYALSASRDYDPAPKLEQIKAPLLAINFADDLINPPELGILEQEIKRVLRVVLDEVDLEPVESDGERISRAAIAFSPSQHGLVVAKPRTPAFA